MVRTASVPVGLQKLTGGKPKILPKKEGKLLSFIFFLLFFFPKDSKKFVEGGTKL